MAPSYHELLVRGVATYSLEFLRAAPELDTVYVPIGLGSGISGMIGAREALRLKTKIVGVVAANAPAYALSFAAGKPGSTHSAVTISDRGASPGPEPQAGERLYPWAGRNRQDLQGARRRALRHYARR